MSEAPRQIALRLLESNPEHWLVSAIEREITAAVARERGACIALLEGIETQGDGVDAIAEGVRLIRAGGPGAIPEAPTASEGCGEQEAILDLLVDIRSELRGLRDDEDARAREANTR